MYIKKNLLSRTIALVLTFAIILPMMPIQYLGDLIPIRSEVRAAEANLPVISKNVTSLDDIQTWLNTASTDKEYLYELNMTSRSTITISSDTTLETDGHVVIKRTTTSRSVPLFTVSSGATFNIGSADMEGTIKIDGGATYTLNTSMSYDFDTERPKGGGTGTTNIKTTSGTTYILFNDGESYKDAHWYQIGGVTSKSSLICNNSSTINIYDGVTIGNVCGASSASDVTTLSGGAIYNNAGTVTMHGGEISWNAIGKSDDGCGPAIYCGTGSDSNLVDTTLTINGGKISNNTAIDTGSLSADGGAISIDAGKLNINGGVISNNRAARGSTSAPGADGGAIIARVGATIYMNDGLICDNFAGGFGGGVLLWNSTFYMYGGTIDDNFARYGGGVGMSTNGESTLYIFNDATISNNYADYGGGVCAGASGYGKNCNFTLFNGNIVYNYAEEMGGGICNYNEGNSSVDLRSGLISNNKVSSTGNGNGVGIYNDTTGTETLVYMSGAIVVDTNNDIYIDDLNNNQVPVKVVGRLTSDGSIGMISVANWNSLVGKNIVHFERDDGGALEVQTNKLSIDTDQYLLVENGEYLKVAAATESSTTFYVARVGDRLYTSLAEAFEAVEDGGTVYLINNATLTNTLTIDKTITLLSETSASKNAANVIDGSWKDADGNTATINTYQPLGDYTVALASSFASTSTGKPGFLIENGGKLILGDSTATAETISATSGGKLTIDGNSSYEINGSLFEIEAGGTLDANYGATITNNSVNAGVLGAGVNVAGTFNLNGGTVKNNMTSSNGSGVYVTGTFNFNNGKIEKNETTANGAGLYVANGGKVYLNNGTITGNKSTGASSNGAGIYLENGAYLENKNVTISSNEVSLNGAGIYIATGAEAIINGGMIINNIATNGNGAGIYNLGDLTMTAGTVSGNEIRSYNTNPLGEGVYLDGSLKVEGEVKFSENNVVHLAKDNVIEVTNELLYSKAIPITMEVDADDTKVIHINTTSDGDILAERILANKSIYHIDGKNIVKSAVVGEENYLIIGNIAVTYDANNAENGTVPQDNSKYLGGDLVSVLPNSGNLKRTNYVFVGWSTVESTPITSSISELSVPIYYEAGNSLIPGTVYEKELRIYSNLTLYAVWAVDANNNTIPDYREDMLDITIEPSENGSVTPSVTEAQSGTLVMLTTTQDDGYEVKSIEVIYEIDGKEEKLTLENGKVIALTDSYYYFNMPIAEVRVVTTFGEQSNNVVRVTWLDANNNESTEDFVSLQAALNTISTNTTAGTMRAKKVTLLRYLYSTIGITVPAGLNFEFDLSNYELDMNSHVFKIENGTTVKLTASSAQGRINFNATGGNDGVGNNLVNNGTLVINGASIVTDAGEDATEYVIINNGDLQITSGTVKHEADEGTAIYNAGTLTITGGNIKGGTYGIEHVNVADKLETYSDTTAISHTLNISNLGTEANYGANADNFISSIYLAKDAHINIPTIFENCNENIVKDENKILLVLDDTAEAGDIILTSNKLPFMLSHFKMHFDLNGADYEIGITSSNKGVLVEKISSLKTEASNNSYEYKTSIELNATLLKEDGTAFKGAKGNVYFFVIEKADEVAQWSKVWDETNNCFRVKETTAEGEEIYYSLQDASGYTAIDEVTGIATLKLSGLTLPISEYVIYALFVGEYEYASHSLDVDATTGSTGAIVASTRGEFKVVQKNIANTNITIEENKTYTGKELVPTIQIYDGTELLEQDTDYQVSTNKSLVNAGDYVITVKGIGNYTGTTERDFEILKYSEDIKIEGVNSKYTHNDQVPEINVVVKDMYLNTLLANSDYTTTYYKYDGSKYVGIQSLSEDVGVYKIVVNGTGTGNYSSTITQEAAFVISEDLSANYEVEIENATLTYNGEIRTLDELGEIKVTNTSNGKDLVKGVDYIVQFGVSTVKNAKQYPVIIQGISANYSEMNLIEVITINPKELTNENTTITFAETEFIYNRKTQKPTITNIEVIDVNTDASNGGTPLTADADYVLILTDNTNAGEAKLEITALNGNYTGKVEKIFTINPKDISSSDITSSIYQSGYTGNEIIPTVTLLDLNNMLLQGATGDYTVEYVADTTANDGAAVNANGYPVNKGTYKAIIKGIGNYTGEKVETFVVANYKGKIIAELSPNKYTYLGNGESLEATIKSALHVTRGTDGEELKVNEDYLLRYNSPENTEIPSEVGEYLLYVVGIGNYDGTQTTVEFSISPLTGSIHIEVVDSELTYNGKVQHPTVELTKTYLTIDGEEVYLSDLRENVDYMITYPDSINVGNYMLQINGVGNYAGNYNFYNYSIAAKTLDAEDITFKSAGPVTKYYDGTDKTLEIAPDGDIWVEYKLADGTVVLLEENKDFTTYYNNNTNAGTAFVVLIGKGNYQESKVYSFVIETRSIGVGTVAEDFEITTLQDKSYTGLAITQDIVLTDTENNKTLELNKDYTVSYLSNIDVGTAEVTVTGKGNYSGTINLTFEIQMNHTIEIVADSKYDYTTTKKEFPITVKDSLGFVLTEDDFEVEYFVDSNCTTKTTASNSGTDSDGSEPVNPGIYYRKVTGTSTNYLGLTAVQKIEIIATKSFQVRITNTTNVYDSTNKNANVVVMDGAGNALAASDYNVVYYTDNNCTVKTTTDDGAIANGGAPKNAGKYYVQAEGIGAYDGVKSNAEFVINPRSLENVDIASIENKYYTGNAITPKPAVTYMAEAKQVILTEGVDFEYNYNNNTNVGTANIKIEALASSRNYTGSKAVTFTIVGEESLSLELANSTIEYTAEEIEITEDDIFVKDENDNLTSIADLKLANTDKEYKIVKDTIKNVGQYTITVEVKQDNILVEKGGVTIEVTPKAVTITPDTLSKKYREENPQYTFTTNIDNANQNGLLGTDTFEGVLERVAGENVGEYEYIIQNLTADNYELTLNESVKFVIEAKDINDSDLLISGVDTEYTYNGNEIMPVPQIIYPTVAGNITLAKGNDFEVTGYEKKNVDSGIFETVARPTEVGEYKLTVKGKNNYTGTKTFTYNIGALKAFNATITNTTREYNRETQTATVVVKSVKGTLTENVDYRLVYYTDSTYTQKTTANDLSGARSEGGAPSNKGNYYLRVEGIGNYLGSTAESEFRITPKNITDKTGSDYDIVISDVLDMTYTGEDIEPTVTLTWNGVALKTEDYTLTYKNNKEVGVATITITGAGNYEGARIINFNIVAITGGTVKITLTDDEGNEITDSTYVYDGTKKEPNVSVIYTPEEGAEKTLEPNKDYTVEFINSIEAGTPSVKIMLTGNYSGTSETSYKIAPRNLNDQDIEITVIPVSETYTGKAEYPEVNVKYKNLLLTGNKDYIVNYGNTEYLNAGDYTVTISSSTGNYTGTVTRTYTIKPYGVTEKEYLTLDFENNNSAFADTTFTQVDLENKLIVKDLNGNTLLQNDYDVLYSSDDGNTWSTTPNSKVGSYFVKVEGKANGNYAGEYATAMRGYTIYTDNLVAEDITITYDGNTHTITESDVTVRTAAGVLLDPSEYEVTFGNIEVKEAGNYTIFITSATAGTNSTATYHILPATFTVGTIANKTYNGLLETPDLEVKGINDTVLTNGVDYQLSYTGTTVAGASYESTKAPVVAGNYIVKVSGRANYAGTIEEIEYKILPKSLADSEVSLALATSENVYNTFTQKVTTKVEYTLDGHSINLVEGVDYEVVSEQEYKDAGEYTIKITAKQGNYTGSAETTYKILPYTGKLQVEMTGTIFNYGTTINQITDGLTVEYGSESLTEDKYEIYIYPSVSSIPEVGSYTLNVTATSSNYDNGTDSAYGSIKFTIIPASTIVVSFENPEVTYNGLEQKPTVDDIFVEGKSIDAWAQEGKTYEIDYGTGNYKDAASYMVTVSYYEGGILKEQSVAAYRIKNAEVTITPNSDQGKIYGQLDEALTYTTSITTGNKGLYENDLLNGSLTRVQGEIVGEYEIRQKDLIADNYDITVSTGVKYKISAKDLNNTDIMGISIAGIQNAYTYTGTAIKPKPTITYLSDLYGTLALIENTDYKLTYKYYDESADEYVLTTDDTKLVSVGNYEVVIEGIGNYTGIVEIEYEISAYVTSFKAIISNNYKEYNKLNQAAQVQVTGIDSILEEDTDYEIVYYTDVACTTPTTLTDNSGAMKIGGAPKNAGTYYIQVEGLGNYIGSTTKAIFVISPKDISEDEITVSPILDQTYVGEDIEPIVILTWGEILGSEDYTVEYKNNKEIGRATVTITGKGNYTGTRTTRFNIVAISGGTIEIDLLEGSNTVDDTTYTYDGEEKKPDVKVTYKSDTEEKELIQDTDYTVAYTNTINAGTVQVTITLIGNYSGTATQSYVINKYDLSNAEMELIPTNLTYTGSSQKPNVQVKYGNIVLEAQRDYEMAYEGAFVNAGEYKVTINALADSNYTGTNNKTFTIDKYGMKSEDKLLLEFKDGNAAYQEMYEQTTFENNLVVTDLNHNVLGKSEYQVSYSTDGATWTTTMPNSVGTYYVKVTGTGNNYAGINDTAQRAFIVYINKLDANDVSKEYKAENYTVNDILSDIALTSDEGTSLSKENFTITFGAVEPRNVGKYTIIITGKTGSGYENLSGTATLEITPADLTIESVSNVTYNGMVQIPEMTVAGITGETVEEGKDYTVRYTGTDVKGNEYDSTIPPIVVGTYKVSIVGRGNYVDSTDNKDYEIGSIGLANGEFVVELITPQMTYNTMVQKPIVKVYYVTTDYMLTLEENKDFEIEYDLGNYIDVGEYKISVNALATSNYSGSKELTFEIVPYVGSLNVTLTTSEFKYGITADKILEGLQVTYLNDTLTESDYIVTFEPNELTVGNTVIRIASRPTNTNYYANENSYAKGFVTFKIVNAEPITAELVNETVEYNGTVQKPTFDEIIVRNKTITEWENNGIIYTVDYGTEEYKLPGEYEITISLYDKENVLQEKATVNYVIEKAKVTVTPVDNQNKIYGQLDDTFEYTTDINTQTGLYADDTFEGILTREKGESVGTYNILLGTLSSENYEIVFTENVKYEIKKKQLTNEDIPGVEMSGIETSYSYNGNSITPLPILVYENESKDTLALIKDTDYTVKYQKYNEEASLYEDVSEVIEVGKYKLIVEGINSYTGTLEREYLITSYVSDFVVTTVNANKVFNGEAQGIDLNIKLADGTLLTENTDYELTYYKDIDLTETIDKPTNIGTYYVQVVGKGNYESSKAVTTFVIAPKSISELEIQEIEAQEYTGNAVTPIPEIKYGDITLVKDTDYTITYSNNVSMGTNTASVTITAKADSNYTGNKTIYFSIVANTTEEFTITLSENTYVYDGNAKFPEVTIVQAGRTLVEGTDYEVTYSDNVNAGQAKVTITLSGFYTGEYERNFTIAPKELTGDMITVSNTEFNYTGTTQKPTINVSFEVDNKVTNLKENEDYIVTYPSESIEIGKYEITVEASGSNYKGTQKVSYEIKSNLEELKVIWNENTNLFKTGSKFTTETIKDTFTLKDSKGNVISSGDYEVAFDKEPNKAGTYTMTVTATSDRYKDETTGEQARVIAIFHIDKASTAGGGGGGGMSSSTEVISGIEGNVKIVSSEESNSLLDKLNHKAYINGYHDNTFAPQQNMTRAEAATMLVRLLVNKNIKIEDVSFTDVSNHWAYENIAIMSTLGIVNGYEDDTFKPGGNITRAEFITMISRFEEAEKWNKDSYFTDVNATHWAYDTVNCAYARGWIAGYGDNTFKPNASITRAEAVTIINRVLGRSPDIEYLNENKALNKYTDISSHWAYYQILEASISHEHERSNLKETWEYLWGDEFKVMYSMNDKTKEMYEDCATYDLGEKVELPAKAYSENKKKFLGWSLSSDGEILKEYEISLDDVVNNTIVLYAIWK